jgi:hypothetical protein
MKRKIEYRNYSEDLIDEHLKLVNELSEQFPALYYPDKMELKALYSGETFTPETRHYAFYNNKLVGFVPSAVEEKVEDVQFGSIHVPFVKNGFDDVEAKLMKKAISVLKSKKVDKVYSYIRSDWDPESFRKKYDFDEGVTLQYDTEFAIKDFIPENYQRPKNVVDFDYQKHRDMLKIAFTILDLNIDLDQMLQRWVENPTFVTSNLFAKDGEIVAMGRVNSFSRKKHSCAVRIYTFKENVNEARKEVLKDLLDQVSKFGFNYIFLSIPANETNTKPVFEDYNFDFVEFRRYEKKI